MWLEHLWWTLWEDWLRWRGFAGLGRDYCGAFYSVPGGSEWSWGLEELELAMCCRHSCGSCFDSEFDQILPELIPLIKYSCYPWMITQHRLFWLNELHSFLSISASINIIANWIRDNDKWTCQQRQVAASGRDQVHRKLHQRHREWDRHQGKRNQITLCQQHRLSHPALSQVPLNTFPSQKVRVRLRIVQ